MSVERYGPKCGIKLFPEAAFCSSCGASVEPMPSPDVRPAAPPVRPKIFCPQCGTELPGDAFFCSECGKAVKPLMREVSDEKWGGGTMALLIIGTILIPLVGIVAGIYGLRKEAKRRQGGLLLGLGIFMVLVALIFLVYAKQ